MHMPHKFTKQKYSPALFDIAQDINAGLPLDLIEKWLETDQTEQDAQRLLEPYIVKGTAVSSDSAGLTKLTKEKGLLEILAIINEPKEILYSYGKSIGGSPLGIWAADNTQMFYDESISADSVVSMLIEAQNEIAKRAKIKVGIAASYGEFYLINGGLYGPVADEVEEFAENETEGGQVAISKDLFARLKNPETFKFTHTKTPDFILVESAPKFSSEIAWLTDYPIPYSENFYQDLLKFQDKENVDWDSLENKYTTIKTVVLIERQGEKEKSHELSLFEGLAQSALLKDIGMKFLQQYKSGQEVKVSGTLGIYVFDEPADAVAFAHNFKQEFAKEEIQCRIGIDHGNVLVFDLPGETGFDIAGMPVNIASKISQDKGQFGNIYLSGAMKDLVSVEGLNEITYTVSGVEMVCYEC